MDNVTPKKLFPKVWDMVAIVALFLVNYVVIQGIMIVLLGLPQAPEGSDVDPEIYMAYQDELGRFNGITYPIVMLSSLFVIWLYARLRGGKGAVTVQHSFAGLNPSVVLAGVLWLLSSQIILEPLTTLFPESEAPGIGRGAWAWVTVAVCAPILEELLCRGVIFGAVRNRWGVKSAIVLSALFFGVIHGELSTMVVAFVAGLIFGVIYVRTSSIFSTMIIHSVNNLLAFSMICFGFEDMTWSDMVGGGVVYYALYGGSVAIFVAISAWAYFKVLRRQRS